MPRWPPAAGLSDASGATFAVVSEAVWATGEPIHQSSGDYIGALTFVLIAALLVSLALVLVLALPPSKGQQHSTRDQAQGHFESKQVHVVALGLDPPLVAKAQVERMRLRGWSQHRSGTEWVGPIKVGGGAHLLKVRLSWERLSQGSWKIHVKRPPQFLTTGRSSVCWHPERNGWRHVNHHPELLDGRGHDVEAMRAAVQEFAECKLEEAGESRK